MRPPRPKYDVTWHPSILLSFLALKVPNSLLSLEDLSKKLLTLIAIITAHRVQTFSLVKLSNIQQFNDRIIMKIPDLINNSRAGAAQSNLVLPFYTAEPDICPASALKKFVGRTKSIRTRESLFIAYKKPHNAVTSQTISRRIKFTIGDSGIDTSIFSSRLHLRSAAKNLGICIETIRKTAGRSDSTRVFTQFL